MTLDKVNLKADERIDSLFLQGLYIIQSKSVFSFSLDARLLGDFAKLPQKSNLKVIDLCAGNGAVTLMLTGKTASKVYGIEIQDRLVEMARRSIQLNGLEEQVEMIHDSLENLPEYFEHDSVDVITCNPPYFKDEETSNKNLNEHYKIARHEITTNLDDIIQKSAYVLKTKGKLYMVHRPERFLEIMDTMRKHRLIPKRVRFVYPKLSKDANMVLIEGIKNGKTDGFTMLPPLVVFDENDNYLPDVRTLIYGED